MRSLTAGLILSSSEATSNRASKQCTCPQTLEIRGWCNRSAKRYQRLCGPWAQRSSTYTYTLSQKWGKHWVYETSAVIQTRRFTLKWCTHSFVVETATNRNRMSIFQRNICCGHAPIPQAIFERISHDSSIDCRVTCQRTQ